MSQLRIGLPSARKRLKCTLSGAVRKRFQERWIIRMSRCSLDTCKRGIRISGCVSMSNAHARDALCGFFPLETGFFLLSASFKNFDSLFSCPVAAQSDFKVFNIASSILKAISHAPTGPMDRIHLRGKNGVRVPPVV